jgi:Arc/MetJ family transcription regulator
MATKVRKQFLLDPEVLRKAREALGAHTDTEAVERALRSVAIDAELSAAQAEFIASEGELVDVYGRLEE